MLDLSNLTRKQREPVRAVFRRHEPRDATVRFRTDGFVEVHGVLTPDQLNLIAVLVPALKA
jgi:hypothetical protein